MKLAGAKAGAYLEGVNPSPVTLIYGENIARTRQVLQKFFAKILGAEAALEMRLEQIDAREAQKDPARLNDALRSVSFFEGARGVLIYEITDGMAGILQTAIEDWQEGDAFLFLQAGNLKKNSKLRKLLEPHPKASVIALYDDPLNAKEIDRMLEGRAIRLSPEARALLQNFASHYDRAGFEPLLDLIATYWGDAEGDIDVDTLLMLLPGQYSATEEEIINAVFRGDAKRVVEELRLAPAQGITFAQLNMMAMWRVKTLLQVKATSNASQGISSLRPPVFGARRQAVEDAVRRWSAASLETALEVLIRAERETRSGKDFLPERAYMERIFLRVAMLSRQ